MSLGILLVPPLPLLRRSSSPSSEGEEERVEYQEIRLTDLMDNIHGNVTVL